MERYEPSCVSIIVTNDGIKEWKVSWSNTINSEGNTNS